MHSENENRQNTFNTDLQEFINQNEHKFTHATRQSVNSKEVVWNLKFWIQFSSWTFCSKCSSLQREKLFPHYEKRPETKLSKSCYCMSNRYVVPHFSLIPDCLKCLTFSDICILRPFILHQGDYVRLPHGYRQRNGITRVSWKIESVENCIHDLQDDVQKERCFRAFQFLMQSKETSYKHFIQLHLTQVP